MSQLADIRDTQSKLEETFSKRMAELEAKLQSGGSAKDTVARVAEEFRTFRELMFDVLRLLRQQISECARSVDNIETRHRRKSLLFLGVAESEKSDCTTAVLQTINNTMALKEFSSSSISVCHRIGNPSKEHHRPILVWFSDVGLRSTVWRAKSRLKGSPITVKEFLTKSRQSVYAKARQHFGVRACWTQDGTIVIRVPDGALIKITTLDELKPLTNKYPKTTDSRPVAGVNK